MMFYLDLNERSFGENLKLADSKTYIKEGYEQEIKFINKDIVSETKNRNRFIKEKENAEDQLKLIEDDLKDLKGGEKINVEETKKDYQILSLKKKKISRNQEIRLQESKKINKSWKGRLSNS